jgi:hypothetical protein
VQADGKKYFRLPIEEEAMCPICQEEVYQKIKNKSKNQKINKK